MDPAAPEAGTEAKPDLAPVRGIPRVHAGFNVLGRFAGALIYIVALVVAVDVIGRFLGMPVRWAFEVYPYVTFWSALLGIGYVAYHDGNVRMDLLVEEGWLGPFKHVQPFFTALVSLLFLAYMVLAGVQLVSNLVDTGRMTSQLQVPLFYHALAIPIGFGLAAVAVLVRGRNRQAKAQQHAGELTVPR